MRFSSALLASMVAGLSMIAAACSDSNLLNGPPPPTKTAGVFVAMQSCGASFRMITNEEDALMSQYAIPNTVDTVDVCETWNGSDYKYQAVAVGSSDNVPGLIDSVQTTEYDNGQVMGYTPAGNEATTAMPTGGSSFDFLYADESTRQASLDYPYYGVSAPGDGACLHPPCPVTSITPAQTKTRPGLILRSNVQSDSALFHKHGIKRLGIRALLDDAEEISRSPEGYRRFKFTNNSETLIRSIDPVSELLIEEESIGPKARMLMRHNWSRVPGGYVRTSSDYEATEEIGGKSYKSRGTISFQRIRVLDARFPSLRGPDTGE